MSAFYDEILTQPDRLSDVLLHYKKSDFREIYEVAELLKAGSHVYFAGMGTSLNVVTAVMARLSEKIKISMVEAGELLEMPELLTNQDILVLISQSGESVEISRALTLYRGRCKIVGITNQPDSILAKHADCTLLLYAGEEKSITNKTFTNTLAVLYMIEAAVNGRSVKKLAQDLEETVPEMKRILEGREEEIREWADWLQPADVVHFIGAGHGALSLARQAGLIFMEGAGCAARAFSTGGFRHGPIEICSERHRAVIFLSDAQSREKTLDLVREMEYYGSKVIVVSNQNAMFTHPFVIENTTEECYVMQAALFMELLLVHVAELRGITAGEFHITNKICKKE